MERCEGIIYGQLILRERREGIIYGQLILRERCEGIVYGQLILRERCEGIYKIKLPKFMFLVGNYGIIEKVPITYNQRYVWGFNLNLYC